MISRILKCAFVFASIAKLGFELLVIQDRDFDTFWCAFAILAWINQRPKGIH